MNYGTSKVFIMIFCSIFMLIGGVAIVAAVVGGNLFFLVWGAMFFFIPLTIMRGRLKQLSTFEKMTYEWYKSEYSEHVQGNKVSCFSCGNPRIHARALMNRTFHREHFCTQCGKTLYYSPEQS